MVSQDSTAKKPAAYELIDSLTFEEKLALLKTLLDTGAVTMAEL